MATLVEQRARETRAWGYTDDSAMLLACARALTSAGTIEPHSLLQALDDCYEPARGFGRGMKIALAAFRGGTPWSRCAFAAWPEGSRGNGAAVRIPPVAAARWPSAGSFELAVALSARVTHAHPDALAFAGLQAAAVAIVIDSPDIVAVPAAFRAELLARVAPSLEVVRGKLEAVFALVASSADAQEAARVLGTSTIASESVSAALWSFIARNSSFAEAVTSAALLGGDVDSICCLVGALAGAMHGFNGLPRTWVANLAHERPSPDEIVELADALHDLLPARPETSWLATR